MNIKHSSLVVVVLVLSALFSYSQFRLEGPSSEETLVGVWLIEGKPYEEAINPSLVVITDEFDFQRPGALVLAKSMGDYQYEGIYSYEREGWRFESIRFSVQASEPRRARLGEGYLRRLPALPEPFWGRWSNDKQGVRLDLSSLGAFYLSWPDGDLYGSCRLKSFDSKGGCFEVSPWPADGPATSVLVEFELSDAGLTLQTPDFTTGEPLTRAEPLLPGYSPWEWSPEEWAASRASAALNRLEQPPDPSGRALAEPSESTQQIDLGDPYEVFGVERFPPSQPVERR